MIPDNAVRVEAYCSTANLGAGFDVFGLALNKYADRARVRITNTGTVRIKAWDRTAESCQEPRRRTLPARQPEPY